MDGRKNELTLKSLGTDKNSVATRQLLIENFIQWKIYAWIELYTVSKANASGVALRQELSTILFFNLHKLKDLNTVRL